MLPTLSGRLQTRVFAVLVFGGLWTLLITPLLPGLTAYRGFYQLAVEGVVDGLVTVTVALAVGLALAAGVALGEFITRAGRPGGEPVSAADRQ